jgi:hypothetical protein
MEQAVPEGANWHQDLLLQMSAGLDSTRPPVITPDTRYCLDEYRGFRHIVRNVYTFQLRPQRLRELTVNLRDCYHKVVQDIHTFLDFLEELSQDIP